jgi:hypothetical protein
MYRYLFFIWRGYVMVLSRARSLQGALEGVSPAGNRDFFHFWAQKSPIQPFSSEQFRNQQRQIKYRTQYAPPVSI